MLDCLLRDIGEHGIGAAESHHRHLGEEQRDLAKGVGRSERHEDRNGGREPQRSPEQGNAQRARIVGAGVLRHLLAECAVDVGRLRAAMAGAGEFTASAFRAEITDQSGGDDDDREGDGKEEDADEGNPGQRDHDVVAQCALSDAHQRLDHDGEHRGLQPEEQCLDIPDLAIGCVDVAQAHDGDDAGHDEQAAGHDAAGGPVHQPADIGRKLLRLRAGQQHAVVQRMQEPALGDPFLLLDQDAVHDRDLARGSAKGQQRHAQPDTECFAEADAVTGISSCYDVVGCVHQALTLPAGQLCVSPVASRHQR